MTLHHAIFHGTIRVRHGQHVEFRRWLGRYDAALAHFPGKLGNVTVPPPAGSNTWSMRLVFETSEQLEAWLDSSERADLLREAAPLLEGGPIYKITRDHPSDGSVTEVLFAKIQPGAENAFRHWSTKINRAQSRYPGYLGVTIQPPFAGQYEWTTLLRFDSPENLDNWLKSPDRRELMREMQTFLVSGSRHRLATSFPSWIPAPPSFGQTRTELENDSARFTGTVSNRDARDVGARRDSQPVLRAITRHVRSQHDQRWTDWLRLHAIASARLPLVAILERRLFEMDYACRHSIAAGTLRRGNHFVLELALTLSSYPTR
ncbi:MAG TPA: hypothetical protein VIT91_12865 [Chthoniobacterales bacterium]